MGSLLQDSELDEEQADVLRYMMMSAEKAMNLVRDFQLNYSHIPKEEFSSEEHSFPQVQNRLQKIQVQKTQSQKTQSQKTQSQKTQSQKTQSQKTQSQKGLSILVAEDDEVSRLYLTTLLRRENWDIDEAANGREAVDLFRQGDYDLILMDISMPGLDGVQAAKTIRETNSAIPILAITAHGEGELQEEFRQAGMNDVLRKPIHDDFLIGKIRSIYPEV